jgi:flavorubredoxin
MSDSYLKATKVSDSVYWVGAIDWAVRDFHGYATQRGTTYNAYLVLADKIALVDTVKAPFTRELLARIASVIDPRRIDYIIANHAEMDHSGGLPEIVAAVKPEKVFASTIGVKALAEHFEVGCEVLPVKENEPLDLGGLSLAFVEARMLHWPDSMATYVADEHVLLSNDAFGMHLASSQRFADEIEASVLASEAAKYYANILMPLSPLITKMLDKVTKLGIEIDTIAPSHGPVWRKDPGEIVGWYSRWAAGERANKAVIAYDTMWRSTAMMASAIADGVAAGGVATKVMPLRASHRSDVMTELLDASALVVGSPTLNNGIFPTVADLLTYAKGLKPRGLVGAAFGSYGWSGEAVKQLEEMLGQMGVELAADGLRAKYVPDGDALRECSRLGVQVAEKILARAPEGGGDEKPA